jgi:YggT family protein
MGSFLYYVVDAILGLVILAIVISAVLSWLIAFEVINMRNRYVREIVRFLDAVTTPILRPFRRFIPTMGGVDISPVIAIIILVGIQRYILPLIFAPLIRLLG